MTALTDRFTRAVDYARIAHAAQCRKGSNIPYLYHLLGVASLVIEFGGNEDQAIAGLLHDTLEDCGAAHEVVIRAQFGDAVINIVKDCTDGTAEGKASHTDAEAKRRDWIERKLAYLAHLKEAPDATLLVSACDKLHNARAIVQDLEDPKVGTRVFDRFTGGRDGTLGYYQALAEIFSARNVPAARVLDATVEWMHELAGAASRVALAGAHEG
jgi:(p)ppGpp synthase/HD superfamily hydrolase